MHTEEVYLCAKIELPIGDKKRDMQGGTLYVSIASGILFILLHVSFQFFSYWYLFNTRSFFTHTHTRTNYTINMGPIPIKTSPRAIVTVNGWRIGTKYGAESAGFQQIDIPVNWVKILNVPRSREFAKFVVMDILKDDYECLLYADRDITNILPYEVRYMCERYDPGLYFTKNNATHFILVVGGVHNISWIKLRQLHREKAIESNNLMDRRLSDSAMCTRSTANRIECVRMAKSGIHWPALLIFPATVLMLRFAGVKPTFGKSRINEVIMGLFMTATLVLVCRTYACRRAQCNVWYNGNIMDLKRWGEENNSVLFLFGWFLLMPVQWKELGWSLLYHMVAGNILCYILRENLTSWAKSR